MPDPGTICGYALGDIRKSLREAIDHRDRRAAFRWTAELVATPGAVGSLWASYWLAWAGSSPGPVTPILIKQSWDIIAAAAQSYNGDWSAFRNNPAVRGCATEMTTRLLDMPRSSPVVWPSREFILYDVGTMRTSTVPVAADGPVVMAVWQRGEDALELRMMAGRFLTFLETGELRGALSAVAWTLMPYGQQGLPMPLICGSRGPASLSAKVRTSPLWFWLEIGRVFFQKRPSEHRGWATMHGARAKAFQTNYTRFTVVDRMRLLLAWILQLRASLLPQTENMWTVASLQLTATAIDLPYQELATELAPESTIRSTEMSTERSKKHVKKDDADSRAEAKMAEADAAIMASLGIDT